MPDLRTQLHDYVESTIERIDAEDVAAAVQVAGGFDRRRSRRFRSVWVFVAAAIASLLLLGAVPLLLMTFSNGEEMSATSSPTTAPLTTEPTPTTTTIPIEGTTPEDWRSIPYQSPGYACGEDPGVGCGGGAQLTLDSVWMYHNADNGLDGIDFVTDRLQPGSTADEHLRQFMVQDGEFSPVYGEYGPAYIVGEFDTAPTGHGVRIVQLDAPPEGVAVRGEAWLEVTVSSISAADFAARPANPQPVGDDQILKLEAPTSSNPVTVDAEAGNTTLIEEAVLVATTDDMMQWIVGFRHPGTYRFTGGYWGHYQGTAIGLSFQRLDEAATEEGGLTMSVGLIAAVAFIGGMIMLSRFLRRQERAGHFDKEGHGTPEHRQPGISFRPLEVPGKEPFD